MCISERKKCSICKQITAERKQISAIDRALNEAQNRNDDFAIKHWSKCLTIHNEKLTSLIKYSWLNKDGCGSIKKNRVNEYVYQINKKFSDVCDLLKKCYANETPIILKVSENSPSLGETQIIGSGEDVFINASLCVKDDFPSNNRQPKGKCVFTVNQVNSLFACLTDYFSLRLDKVEAELKISKMLNWSFGFSLGWSTESYRDSQSNDEIHFRLPEVFLSDDDFDVLRKKRCGLL